MPNKPLVLSLFVFTCIDQCYEDYFVLETLYILNVAEKARVDIDLQEAEKGIRGTSGKIRTTLCSFSH